MDRKSKMLFWVFIFALCVAGYLSYRRYIVLHDYTVSGSLQTGAPEVPVSE